jgi:predicted RNA-binding protein with PUA domain
MNAQISKCRRASDLRRNVLREVEVNAFAEQSEIINESVIVLNRNAAVSELWGMVAN